MTTAATQLPPGRPFTPEECAALITADIIAEGEQAAVLAGKRRFTVDECLAMLEVGVLHEDDRIELLDGVIIVMAPINVPHLRGTDHSNQRLVMALGNRAMVRVQGSILLNDHTMPQPDIVVLRMRSLDDMERDSASDVYWIIEFSDSSLEYDLGVKLARYAESGIPEVWVGNLRAREVIVHTEPSGSEYLAVRTCRVGQSISPQAFPDVALAVDDFMPPATVPEGEQS